MLENFSADAFRPRWWNVVAKNTGDSLSGASHAAIVSRQPQRMPAHIVAEFSGGVSGTAWALRLGASFDGGISAADIWGNPRSVSGRWEVGDG
jgi:hypothetical protein